MPTRKRTIAIYLVATLTGSLLLVAAILRWLYADHVAKHEALLFDHSRAERYVDAIAEDLKAATASPPLAVAWSGERASRTASDAGPYLNPRLRWLEADRETQPPAALELPRGVVDAIGPLRSPWLSEIEAVHLAGIDFSWMGELARFDHWSLESAGPLAAPPTRPTFADPATEPRPDLSLLGLWVKLRLIAMVQGEPAKNAAAEITRLAQLALTTQRITLMLAGISWLSQLEDVRDLLMTKGLDRNAAVPRLDPALLARTRRALWGQMAYLELGVSETLTIKVFGDEPTPGPGLCAALNEQLPGLRLQRALLGPFYQVEMERTERLVARLAPHCRPSAAIRSWYDKTQLPAPLQGDLFTLVDDLGEVRPRGNDSDDSWQRVQRIPPLHKLLGLTLASVARPDYLSSYATP